MKTVLQRFWKETVTLMRSIPAVLVGLLLVGVVAMNLMANKSIHTGVSWLALDCGLLFSWIVFLVMDIVTKRFGVKAANTLTVISLLINLLIVVVMIACSFIPGEWSQSYVEGSEGIINGALDLTFRSSWFVILGSSVAFVVSAFVNNFLNRLIYKAFKKDNFVAFGVSTYVSTFVGQLVDNLLFATIVCLNFFGWTFVQCLTCALVGAVAELLFEVIFSPLGYRFVRKMERDGVGKEYLDLIGGHGDESIA